MSNDSQSEVLRLKRIIQNLERQNEDLRRHQIESGADTVSALSSSNTTSILTSNIFSGDSHLTASNLSSALNSSTKSTNLEDDNTSVCSNASGGSSTFSRLKPSANRIIKAIDECSWLYRPLHDAAAPIRTNPIQWMRTEFDDPDSNLGTIKDALLHQLRELAMGGNRLVSSGSSPALCLSNSGSDDTFNEMLPISYNRGKYPAFKKPVFGHLSQDINTNTFTRPKKQRESILNKNMTRDGASSIALGSHNDIDKVEDMTDVRVIARMQEANLKAQVMATNRRQRSESQHSADSLEEDDESPERTKLHSRTTTNNNNNNNHLALQNNFQNHIPRKSLPNLGFATGQFDVPVPQPGFGSNPNFRRNSQNNSNGDLKSVPVRASGNYPLRNNYLSENSNHLRTNSIPNQKSRNATSPSFGLQANHDEEANFKARPNTNSKLARSATRTYGLAPPRFANQRFN